MTTFHLLLLVWAVSASVMAAVWAVSMRVANVGYVDVAWAALMAVAALMAGAFGQGGELPRLLVALLGSLWGMRLSLHLLVRVLHEPEDGRYQALRAQWSGSRSRFFVFFQMQAVVVALFALPFIAAASRHSPELDGWIVAAVAIWILAVGGEWLADRQLAAFRADAGNRGKTCRAGLWAWSRHPNYFGEMSFWWGLWLFGVAAAPALWWTFAGPLAIALMFRFVSLPMIETRMRERRPAYADWVARSSLVLPRPPRSAVE